MGAKISRQKIRELSAKKVRKLKSSTVRDLEPDVKEIYERRISMQLTTVEDMENIADVLNQRYEHQFLIDFKPEVLAVYEKRVEYHNKLTDLLRNSMVEASAEVTQTVHPEDEDEKEDE